VSTSDAAITITRGIVTVVGIGPGRSLLRGGFWRCAHEKIVLAR
jgi:hypothetical protein